MHLRIEGKGDKVRLIPVAMEAQRLLDEYLKTSDHGEDLEGPLFSSREQQHYRRASQAAQPQIGI